MISNTRQSNHMEVLLFTSGKGGAGCSTIASSIATVAAGRGVRTLLVELSAYNSTQSIIANVPTAGSLSKTPSGDQLSQTTPLRSNLDLIWGSRFVASRAEDLSSLIAAERRRGFYKLVIIDMAAGDPMSDRLIASLSTLAILVTLPDISSVAANFGLFKNLTSAPMGRLGLLLNRISDESEASDLSIRFSTMCEQFVGRIPETLTALPLDTQVQTAHLLQKSVMSGTSRSAFARRIERLTDRLVDRSHERSVQPSTQHIQPARFERTTPLNKKRTLADIKD